MIFKKLVSVILVLVCTLTVVCSCEKQEDDIVEVGGAEDIAATIGADFVVPSIVKYDTYSVIDGNIGEARFTFNSYVFEYRASKVKADSGLHGHSDDYHGTSTITIDTRAEVKVYSYSESGRVAVWNYKGTNYTLYSERNPTDDTYTELLDLLIR